jgi:hypothetical protein
VSNSHLVLHAVAIKKHGTAEAIADVVGLDPGEVGLVLGELAATGRVVENQGRYALTSVARFALDSDYSRHYGELRANDVFVDAYNAFERINLTLKSLITDWQTIEVGGERVTNAHADRDYDHRLIDWLGELHERADRMLQSLAAGLPRLQIYRDKLLAALERAEDGQIEWVSDARIESYHTVWFELHEDLLRVLGRERAE